jgi:hypothetical protein
VSGSKPGETNDGCLETAADVRQENYRDTAAVSDGADVSTRMHSYRPR